jgi:Domain of unknown function (DUF1772)
MALRYRFSNRSAGNCDSIAGMDTDPGALPDDIDALKQRPCSSAPGGVLSRLGSKVTPIHKWEDIRMLFAYDIFDFLALLSALMLAGLMVILSTVMRKMWREQNDADAAAYFKHFLKYAAADRILSTMSITPVIAALVMAFAAKPTGAQVGFAYAGGGIFLVGFFLWTAFFNLPVYKAVDAWTLAEYRRVARNATACRCDFGGGQSAHQRGN